MEDDKGDIEECVPFDRLHTIPAWYSCDRWRLEIGDRDRNREPRLPRSVMKVWRVRGAPSSEEWISEMIISTARPPVGKYFRLRAILVHHRWDGLIEWLAASETPLLRDVRVLGFPTPLDNYQILLQGTWIAETVQLVLPMEPFGEAVLSVVEQNTANHAINWS